VDAVFRKGHILLCVRNLDLVCVYDPEAGELVWAWGPGELEMPHHPNLLDNGNLLIFDNGMVRNYSRVIELDPRTRTIVWEYTAEPKDAFFSASRGSCQRLPNGNTLVTNSDSGHVFEVTHDGEIVWEFYNPVIHEKFEARAAIYRMLRLTSEHPGLERLSQSRATSGG
jgi:outer membrane protein assembly factor BamB